MIVSNTISYLNRSDLKRFELSASGEATCKLSTKINFKKILRVPAATSGAKRINGEMSSYWISDRIIIGQELCYAIGIGNRPAAGSDPLKQYRLYGVINHLTLAEDVGHYIAICRDPQKPEVWRRFDDSRCVVRTFFSLFLLTNY